MRPGRVALAGIASAAALALASMASLAQSGPSGGSPHVRGLIEREAKALADEGFAQAQAGIHTRVARGQTHRFVLRLEEGRRYAMIAACDQGCNHVDLALYDGGRKLLTRNAERQSIVTVAGAARAGGLYEVEVKLPGCRQASCDLAFAVLWQGQGPTEQPVVIASSMPPQRTLPAPSPAPGSTAEPRQGTQVPAVSGFTGSIERRLGHEVEANNYREQKVASLEECERLCLADRACAALEFYRENRSCGLFKDVPGMRPARNIDAGIRRAR